MIIVIIPTIYLKNSYTISGNHFKFTYDMSNFNNEIINNNVLVHYNNWNTIKYDLSNNETFIDSNDNSKFGDFAVLKYK